MEQGLRERDRDRGPMEREEREGIHGGWKERRSVVVVVVVVVVPLSGGETDRNEPSVGGVVTRDSRNGLCARERR